MLANPKMCTVVLFALILCTLTQLCWAVDWRYIGDSLNPTSRLHQAVMYIDKDSIGQEENGDYRVEIKEVLDNVYYQNGIPYKINIEDWLIDCNNFNNQYSYTLNNSQKVIIDRMKLVNTHNKVFFNAKTLLYQDVPINSIAEQIVNTVCQIK